jgi:hypothetical protein
MLCSITVFFSPENLAIYEITWKNVTEWHRPQMTVRHLRIAYWISKAINTQSEYVTTISFYTANNGCMKAPQCYVKRISPVLLKESFFFVTIVKK